jgi:N-acetylglutamate synthase-like GNAT family acetyltransferase
MALKIEPISVQDLDTVQEIVTRVWEDAIIVVHNDAYHIAHLNGIKAVIDECIVGCLHYQVREQECEILSLVSLQENQGIGSALLATVEAIAKSQNCKKLTLITTNDNLHALGFYQRTGFRLSALYPGQVEVSRKIKPSIPLIGANNIPLRDELKLEKTIS